MKRQHATPVILQGQETLARLYKIPEGEPPLTEKALQEILFKCPDLLPVEELEPGFTPLIPLGMEIQTRVGAVDIMYATPSGYLTIVETKLWKNHEAIREVVAQILDYGKELSKWNYDDLDIAVKNTRGKSIGDILRQANELSSWNYDDLNIAVQNTEEKKSIRDILQFANIEYDEPLFIDTINRNLKAGRFLLLIAGDHIRENVESMVEYLQVYPGLHFSLALVELAFYRLSRDKEWPIYVQPRVVQQSVVIERVVVEVRAPEGVQVSVRAAETGGRAKRVTLTEGAFFDSLQQTSGEQNAAFVKELMGELQGIGLEPSFGSDYLMMKLQDPGGTGTDFTVVTFSKRGTFGVWNLGAVTKKGYSEKLVKEFVEGVCKLLGIKALPDGSGIKAPYPTVDKLRTLRDDESGRTIKNVFLQQVSSFVNDIQDEARK